MQNTFISAIGKVLSEDISILCGLKLKKNKTKKTNKVYIYQWQLLVTG